MSLPEPRRTIPARPRLLPAVFHERLLLYAPERMIPDWELFTALLDVRILELDWEREIPFRRLELKVLPDRVTESDDTIQVPFCWFD